MKYRKKPVVVEAVQWTGENLDEITSFVHSGLGRIKLEIGGIHIVTLEGLMKCNEGDYIIKGIKGEFYPCKPDIFEATYEKV